MEEVIVRWSVDGEMREEKKMQGRKKDP